MSVLFPTRVRGEAWSFSTLLFVWRMTPETMANTP